MVRTTNRGIEICLVLRNTFFSFPPFYSTNYTHTKNAAAAVSPEAPKPSASEGKAASETGGWRGMRA